LLSARWDARARHVDFQLVCRGKPSRRNPARTLPLLRPQRRPAWIALEHLESENRGAATHSSEGNDEPLYGSIEKLPFAPLLTGTAAPKRQ
jgi:hypothetical protein